MDDNRRKEIARQVTYLVLGCLLAYGATWGMNQLFHLGGSFDRLERLNPLFVQEAEQIPSDAIKHLYWESLDFGRAATLVVRKNQITLEDVEGAWPRKTSQQFLGSVPERDYHVFLERVRGRGLITIVQQPTKDNNYIVKIRIEDPYGDGSEYKLNLYWQSGDLRP